MGKERPCPGPAAASGPVPQALSGPAVVEQVGPSPSVAQPGEEPVHEQVGAQTGGQGQHHAAGEHHQEGVRAQVAEHLQARGEGGRGMALTGLIVGYIGIAIYVVITLILVIGLFMVAAAGGMSYSY